MVLKWDLNGDWVLLGVVYKVLESSILKYYRSKLKKIISRNSDLGKEMKGYILRT